MCYRKSSVQKSIGSIFLICLFFVCGQLHAQNRILFIQPSSGKIIHAKPGDILSIRYTGYLGQTEYFKSTLAEIKDSSFILGVALLKDNSKVNRRIEQQLIRKEIRYDDVIAFRRSGVGRNLLKAGCSLGAAIGTIYYMNQLYKSNQVSDLGKIGISLGIAIGINTAINLVLPDKPNHAVQDGWQIKSVKD